MCVCYCCKQHLFSKDSSKSQEREWSLWKKGVTQEFYDERGKKNQFSPDFSPLREGLLTYFDRWVFTKPWPVLQTGLRGSPAFFRIWSVSSSNAD